jgi:hypothetical protein
MIRWRRQVRDYERRIDVSHAMILVAMERQSAQAKRPSLIFMTDSKEHFRVSDLVARIGRTRGQRSAVKANRKPRFDTRKLRIFSQPPYVRYAKVQIGAGYGLRN